MRRFLPVIVVLVLVGLACACPATGNVQGTISAMQNTVGAALTVVPGMLTELPGMLTNLPATLNAEMETHAPVTTGTIRGYLIYPSEFLPAQRIVAFDAATMAFMADVFTVDGQSEYELVVPVGDYYIVAYLPDGSLSAGYSQAVPCGLLASCNDHSLILVHVEAGAVVEDINPQDWYANPGDFPAMP
jgi:hypothetical protein